MDQAGLLRPRPAGTACHDETGKAASQKNETRGFRHVAGGIGGDDDLPVVDATLQVVLPADTAKPKNSGAPDALQSGWMSIQLP